MPDPEWELVVTSRDGATTYNSFASTADSYGDHDTLYGDWGTLYGTPAAVGGAPAAAATPILAFDGQDPIADIGVGRLTLPLTDPTNTYLDEDRLVHVQVRGTRAVSFKIGAADQTIIDRDAEGGETAVWQLETLFGVLNEGTVDPPGGADSLPASPDRLFDWSDPARDNSDFTTPDELGTVTDAQTNYPVLPYAVGSTGAEMEFPDDTMVIGPAGYGWGDDAPGGRCYGYIDYNFATTGYYRVNGTFDNGGELRVDGKTIQTFTIGFGNAFHVPKFLITAGVHRVAYVMENGGGGPDTEGPCTAAIEFVAVDAADVGTFVMGTSAAWGIMEFPAHPPGFTIGKIIETVLAENVSFGQLVDVDVSFTDSVDTAGNPWSDTWDVSTKSTGSLASFFLKELSETYCDFRMRSPEGAGIVLDAWNKDGRGATTAVELERGVNIGSLHIDAAPTLATTFLVTHNIGGELGYHRATTGPVSGHPVKEQGLSLGAAHSIDEVVRVAEQQLSLFARKRGMTTVTHLTNQDTPDAAMPGMAYWTGDKITVPTDPALTPGSVRVIAMTVQLSRDTGQLEFTPQLGDLIMPGPARPAQALRKMAAPNLGGNARPVA